MTCGMETQLTAGQFLSFYPQFSSMPHIVMCTFIDQANLRFYEFCDAAPQARRLYAAHKLTMYARSVAPDGATASQLTDAGGSAQVLSKSVGGVSVSRSETSGTSSINGWNEWKQTIFGLQLIGLAKMSVAGGVYVP